VRGSSHVDLYVSTQRITGQPCAPAHLIFVRIIDETRNTSWKKFTHENQCLVCVFPFIHVSREFSDSSILCYPCATSSSAW